MTEDTHFLNSLIEKSGKNKKLNENKPWVAFEFNAQDIKLLYADAYRKVERSDRTGEKVARFQPIVVIQAGKDRLSFLNLNVLWSFTNALIYPERFSFKDFKGIISSFLPFDFFNEIISDCDHSIFVRARENSAGEWVASSVDKYTEILANYDEIRAMIQETLLLSADTPYVEPALVRARYVNNDTMLFSWDNREIEIKEYKTKFVVVSRLFHHRFIIQPREATEVKGRLASVVASDLLSILESAIIALEDASSMIRDTHDSNPIHHVEYVRNSGKLPFHDRNLLEYERWTELKEFFHY